MKRKIFAVLMTLVMSVSAVPVYGVTAENDISVEEMMDDTTGNEFIAEDMADGTYEDALFDMAEGNSDSENEGADVQAGESVEDLEDVTEDMDAAEGVLFDEAGVQTDIVADESVAESSDIIEVEELVGVANTHVHKYTAYTGTITHPATGHYERVLVRYDMTTDPDVIWNMVLKGMLTADEAEASKIYETHVVCTCGEWLDVDENGNWLPYEDQISNIGYHCEYLGHSYESDRIFIGYKYPVYENQWVEDKAAWTENVVKGYKCNGCGETHSKEPVDIEKGTLTTIHAEYEYTGWERKPNPTLTVNGKTLTLETDYTVGYNNNKNVGTATMTAYGRGDYQGSVSVTFKIIPQKESTTDQQTDVKDSIPIYRVFNPRTGEHFYTPNKVERDNCVNLWGWNGEGIAWYSPKKSDYPVYRVMNPNNKSEHHYTVSVSERDWLVSLGWRNEGIAFYSSGNKNSKNGYPVYRHYHPIQRTGNHHYTTSKYESDHIVAEEGWRYEDICWYVNKMGK